MSKPILLLVEDDVALADLLIWHFERQGYEIERAADGDEALIFAEERSPDLVMLDWMVEGIPGIEVCRRLRRGSATAHVPIIMLAASTKETHRIRSLQAGADEYVTKPFSPGEFLARVTAVLRRVRPALAGEQLVYRDIEMDVNSYRVRRRGKSVHLGPTEFRLLRYLMEHPGRVHSRERLLAVWKHGSDIDVRTVDGHIRRLRKSLNDRGLPDVIRTVRSAGYSLDTER